MRIRSPASRATIRIRFSLADVGLAMVSPFLALYGCHALILTSDSWLSIIGYWEVSLISSLIAFVVFRIHETIPRYLSVHDLSAVAKAVVLGELLAGGIWFICTRLAGIPRSVPLLHAAILGAGLLTVRILAHVGDMGRGLAAPPDDPAVRNIILIGLNRLSFIYMQFLHASPATAHRVIAVLDDQARWIGRSVGGVRVFGPPAQLEPLIEEFAVHGVRTHGVVIGGRSDMLSEGALNEVRRVCARHDTELVFVPHVFGADPAKAGRADAPSPAAGIGRDPVPADFALPRYFRCRRVIDCGAALLLLVLLAPVLLVVAALAFVDVGSPVFFWQQRTGLRGHAFLLYKIRTLRPALDGGGRPISEELRLSWLGRFLRKTRLDELPQLLSVLVGDMSLIGPRPLLPKDQPPNSLLRLMVRPGITGWAQVNGGSLISPMEKGELDEWYIRHASLALDLRIVWLTIVGLLRGRWGAENASARAHAARTAAHDDHGSRPRQTAASAR